MPFQIIRNDITKVKADVIVNTANPYPVIGSGTDSAVYRVAGEQQLLAERKRIGYKFQHVLKVEFDSDNEKFGRILYALAHCQLHPEFRISYFVKDPEASKNELLGRAVSDAREKANVLTTAAGVSLKEIQSIDYSWGEINFEYHPMNKELLMEDCMCEPCEAGGSYDVNMEPDDIEVSDTVTVIWEI